MRRNPRTGQGGNPEVGLLMGPAAPHTAVESILLRAHMVVNGAGTMIKTMHQTGIHIAVVVMTGTNMMIATGTEMIIVTGIMTAMTGTIMTGVVMTGINIGLHLGVIPMAETELQTIQAIMMIMGGVVIPQIVRELLQVIAMIGMIPETTIIKIADIQDGVTVALMTGLLAQLGQS